MERPVPAIARTAFILHVIVAVISGAAMLIAPTVMGATLGYPEAPADLIPVIRSFGALLLFFGGLTSLLAVRAASWERVEIIVQAELVYLAVTSVLYVIYLAAGSGPLMGNIVYLVLHAVLFVLFYMGWTKRPA